MCGCVFNTCSYISIIHREYIVCILIFFIYFQYCVGSEWDYRLIGSLFLHEYICKSSLFSCSVSLYITYQEKNGKIITLILTIISIVKTRNALYFVHLKTHPIVCET